MTTNTIAIDDLLAKVGIDLVEKYERVKLPEGQTLRQVNEEYLGMKISGSFLQTLIIVITSAVFGLILSIIMIVKFDKNPPVCYLSFLPTIVSIVFIYLAIKRADRDAERLKVLVPILTEFRETVTILTGGCWLLNVAERIQYVFLSDLALQIIDAETSFDEVRLGKARETSNIVYSGQKLLELQEGFRKVSAVAESHFGLKFDKGEIFAEAKRYRPR